MLRKHLCGSCLAESSSILSFLECSLCISKFFLGLFNQFAGCADSCCSGFIISEFSKLLLCLFYLLCGLADLLCGLLCLEFRQVAIGRVVSRVIICVLESRILLGE